MKLVNLTGRRINIVNADGSLRLKIEPTGEQAHARILENELQPIESNNCHLKVVNYIYSHVLGLPEPESGVLYIVSYAVLQALDDSRPDVIAPDTSQGSIVREGSRMVGVQQFRIL